MDPRGSIPADGPRGSSGTPIVPYRKPWSLVCFGLLVLLPLQGCSTTLTVPCPVDARSVYLIDYGTHSTLVLPASDERHVEYAYADWAYAVEANRGVWGSIRAVAWPTKGALGRRYWEEPITRERLRGRTGAQEVYRLPVEAESVQQLVNDLNQRFEQSERGGNHRQALGMTYVPDDQSYTVFHTCNTELLQWLERLRIQAQGLRFWSEFHIRSPSPHREMDRLCELPSVQGSD